MTIIKPIKYKDLKYEFGQPEQIPNSDFITFALPFPMNKGKTKKITTHQYIAKAVQEAFQEILDRYGLKYIKKFKLDQYHGCHVIRKAKGHDNYSVHSWGLAIDYCANYGPFGRVALTPSIIVQAFKKRGFEWGGDWKYLHDGMHFTAVKEGPLYKSP